jgi:type II secretion system protein H
MTPLLTHSPASPDLASRRRRRRWRDGLRPRGDAFTLVELLLVVVLIAILSGSVVVSLSGRTEKYALRTAAEDLAAAVRFASSQARLEQCPHRVVFSDDRRAFWVESRDEASGEYRAVAGMPGAQHRLSQDVRVARVMAAEDPAAAGVTAAADAAVLSFAPDGAGFCGRIELVGRDQSVLTVAVARETGDAHVEQQAAAPGGGSRRE